MGGDPVETLSDNDVPGWWEELGLPGLIDIHIPPPADDATRMSALRACGARATARQEPGLDDDWLQAVCWFNGLRLIGD